MAIALIPLPAVRAYGDGGRLLYDSKAGGDVSCAQGNGTCSYRWP